MPVIVIVVAGPAPHLRRIGVQHGYDGMIHDLFALDAVVVDDVAQPVIPHMVSVQRMDQIITKEGA
jgi:hypothetical protein